jgi:hypothetical protein
VHTALAGERVVADVSRDERTGGLDLFITKPYLSNGMATIHLSS